MDFWERFFISLCFTYCFFQPFGQCLNLQFFKSALKWSLLTSILWFFSLDLQYTNYQQWSHLLALIYVYLIVKYKIYFVFYDLIKMWYVCISLLLLNLSYITYAIPSQFTSRLHMSKPNTECQVYHTLYSSSTSYMSICIIKAMNQAACQHTKHSANLLPNFVLMHWKN